MKTLHLLIAILAAVVFTACSSNDEDAPATTSDITVILQLPEVANPIVKSATASIVDVNTMQQTAVDAPIVGGNRTVLQLKKNNLYSITVHATIEYEANGKTIEAEIMGQKENIQVTDNTLTIEMPMFFTKEQHEGENDNPHNGLLLAEIFCAGTSTPMGTYYYADKYFVIYNNTDKTIYADSLLLLESDFLTTMKEEYIPDIMSDYMAVSAIYMIPGSGHDHPIAPGGRMLLVDNALDHTRANPNSWDETLADFEWYDESTNPQFSDVDNPNVPNLERIYSKTQTMWSPHTQGFKSYAIATMKTDKMSFLIDYMYNYEAHIVGATGEGYITGMCFKMPNEWIVDAVNMSAQQDYQWIVTSPKLDRGFTFSSLFAFDDSRFNKSVRRKVISRVNDRAILMDTNNSTEDFEPRVTADPYHVF